MALLFPNAVKADISLGCDLTLRNNSGFFFFRGRSCRSCPPADLWGGDELGEPHNVPVWSRLVA